jgi:type IV secretory pathway ATPase VirB11/archaellum biosynthesis ATPase
MGLRNTLDLNRLAYAAAPQILPRGIKVLGEAQYRVEPFSINLLKHGRSTVYLPVLDSIKLEDRVRIFDLIRRVRAFEWQSLSSPISLDLSDIIEQRKGIMRELGDLNDLLLPFAAYSSVGLAYLFPLLMDDRISEFFIDKESSLAYLDHRDFGRCNSALYIGKKGIMHLLTFARMALGKTMDFQSPSLRSSIKTKDFNIRISADAPPLSLEGTSMCVRKFFSTPIKMHELVSNSTLTPEAAAYLVRMLHSRKNFSIYGESGSGKTTLAVALDLLTPSTWRKISVESDVAENITQSRFGKHQIRLLASSGTKPEQERRTTVLNSLLHKSPDYVFFGEILSKEDSASLFQILAAGLKCIHTIHAESAESLFRRLLCQHGVPAESLRDLDVLVEMRKRYGGDKICRRVFRISEVEKEPRNPVPRIFDVFRWDEGSGALQHNPNDDRTFLHLGEDPHPLPIAGADTHS